MKGDYIMDQAERDWAEVPEYADLSPEEAKYDLHNEHGVCGCQDCEIFREQIR